MITTRASAITTYRKKFTKALLRLPLFFSGIFTPFRFLADAFIGRFFRATLAADGLVDIFAFLTTGGFTAGVVGGVGFGLAVRTGIPSGFARGLNPLPLETSIPLVAISFSFEFEGDRTA